MNILTKLPTQSWHETIDLAQQQAAIAQFEAGSILFFPQLAFKLTAGEQTLLSPEFSHHKAKNISYDSKNGSLRGIECDSATQGKITHMMRRFNRQTYDLITHLFPTYIPQLQIARTSYRPVEIAGRQSPSYKKDDTRLHVDAFPSNPVQGRRILRVFSNINPHGQARVWNVGESFEKVAQRFLPQIKRPLICGHLLKALHLTKSLRTPYDHIMLQLHDRMKADIAYQQQVAKTQIQLPANTTWIVQTDCVSHAALSGQYVLEQTFYLPVSAMTNEQQSPLRILERLRGKVLVKNKD